MDEKKEKPQENYKKIEQEFNSKLYSIERSITKLEREKREIDRQLNDLRPQAEKIRMQLSQLKTTVANSFDWSKEKYEWSDKVQTLLTDIFKFKSFKFKQCAAINAVLSKKDVILIMPTGGGKSLTYQLPALVTKGITLVVSPLLSLITDQLHNLNELGITAATINSGNSKTASKPVYDVLTTGKGNTKLIYVTPEWLAKSKRFMTNLQKAYERGGLDRIAIDEVHCCSLWGHDFRPDYKFLHIFKSIFPNIPIIGVTATATEKVIVETQELLGIEGCLVLKSSFNRHNLFYKVDAKPSNMLECAEYIRGLIRRKYENESGIIYTHSINDSIELAKELNNLGISSAAYHANMEHELRDKIHNKWIKKKYQVICATVAFGMGIDKPDVRFVIHHSLPKSMENYYQESGRAGRDGNRADCILLYSFKDVFRVSGLVATSTPNALKHLYEMVRYCITTSSCRRILIGKHFGEEWTDTRCQRERQCDICLNNPEVGNIDIKKYYEHLVKITTYCKEKLDQSLTPLRLIDTWFQTGSTKKFRLESIPVPRISRELGEQIITYLIIKDFLKENLHFTAYSTISYIGPGKNKPGEKILFEVNKSQVSKSMIIENSTQNNTSEYTRHENASTSSKSSKRKHSEKSGDTTEDECSMKVIKID